MAKKTNTIKTTIIPRNGTAASWAQHNPVLLAGEMGVETDTGKFKFGDGTTPWNQLPYPQLGLSLTVLNASADRTLSNEDSVIFVEEPITLTLPSNPIAGKIYYIKTITSQANVRVNVGADGHYINDGKVNKKTSWGWVAGDLVMFIWDAANKTWQAGYSRINT